MSGDPAGMGNSVIGVGNYVIATPSELGNYMIADSQRRLSASPGADHPARYHRFSAPTPTVCRSNIELRGLNWGYAA